MKNKRPILVGCEESQVVCATLRRAGFEACSCDLQPTRGNPGWHYQKDIMEVIPTNQWGLIILHPDCTAMSLAGNSTYGRGMPKNEKRIEQIEWTINLWELAKKHGERVALENPASVIFPKLRELGAVVQFVQPYEFGHLEQKKTGFALHNLPLLRATNNVHNEMMKLPKNERERIHYMAPSPTRKRDRSVTFPGIADAMIQWASECSRL